MTTAQPLTNSVRRISASVDRNGLSHRRILIGRVLTGLATAFCIFDATLKLFKPPFVVQATLQLGYPESTIIGIGAALLSATVLYVVPRTSFLGALLLTGYLGGAVASNIRAQQPLFNVVFPVIFACIAWAGLVLRDRRLQDLLRSK